MLACDFFPVDCAVTLKRISVFFVLEVGNRSVHLLGTATNPDGRWTTQQVRNLVRDLDDHLTQFRFLVRDRAGQSQHRAMPSWPMWASAWSGFLHVARGRTVLPNGSCARSEPKLTDRMLIFSRRHLCAVLAEYVRHYNGRRPHRACGLRPPRPTHPVADSGYERIKCRPVLDGLINEYERAA
jgi:putative transposase